MRILNRILKSMVSRLLPRPISTALMCLKVLEVDYGHYNSSKKWSCTDKNGNIIPWYTYPAIEYITQLDYTDKAVLNMGWVIQPCFGGRFQRWLEVLTITKNGIIKFQRS
jgi:hypothetical protein